MKKIYLSISFLLTSLLSFAQWGPINTGLTNLTSGAKLLGSSGTYIFSGTLGGAKMYRSNNNGNSWSEITPPVASNVPECGYYFNGKYFSGLNSSMDCIYYSSNDGTTWNSVTGAPQTTVVRGFFSLAGNIFAYTSNKGVYRSTDGGLTWSAANNGLTNQNVIWMETINSKLFAATIGAGVFVSSDNGSTWTPSNTGIASGALNASFIWRMGTSLYYYEQGGSYYTSSNDGANWSTWSKPAIYGLGLIEVNRIGSNLYMETRHFSGGLKDSLYLSTNEGANWTNITDNLSASNLNAYGITEFNGYAFIAYNISSPGMGIYRKATTVGIEEKTASETLNIYPNPFTDKIEIATATSNSIKQISVYDCQGKLVLTTSANTTSLNTSELVQGIYFIEVMFDNNTFAHKKLVK